MRAVTFSQFGGPEVLEVRDLPDREPGPGWVRIKVEAATINPTDLGYRAGRQSAQLGGLEPPYIPGMELAGTVDKAGEGVSMAAGERVMAVVVPRRPVGGAMQGSIIVPQSSIAPMPEGADFAHAATIPMNGLTVRQAFDKLALKPGDTLAVTGAAGAVGAYAVEIGAAEGLRVVAIASPSDEAFLRQIGAEWFVPRGDDASAKVRELAPDGVDGLIDAALVGQAAMPAVRDNGGFAVVRPYEGETERGITVHTVRVAEYAENQAALAQLGDMATQGKLTLRVSETYPVDQVADAHRRMEAGGIRGRLVITF